MSEIRKGRHTVQVHKRKKTRDKYGETVYQLSDTPITYQCNVQPLSAEEALALSGSTTVTAYRIKYWPSEHGGIPWEGGPYSRIVIEGKNFEQRGEPLVSRMSGTTGHTKIVAVSYTAEVK